MKIGDKVRFLSEIGGGRVSGFQGKDVVLVEDEDGFEIPMLKNEVVVIGSEDYDIGKVNTMEGMPTKPVAAQTKHVQEEEEEKEIQSTFRPKPLERKEGEKLNLYLSFLPDDPKSMTNTGFESYLVNDSNYYMQVTLLQADGANWRLRFSGMIEPNSKLFVEAFDKTQLNDLERLCVQALAWKEDKPFQLKPALTTAIRLNLTKFYKLHIFQPNEFFRDPNWTVPVIQNDEPVRSVFADAEQMREALLGSKPDKETQRKDRQQPARVEQPQQPEGPIVIDLHAEELLETSSGLSNGDILMVQMNEFRKVMDANIKKKGTKIVFIHGKGEGVLRKNILQELKYRYKSCTSQDASFQEYGYGATMVKI